MFSDERSDEPIALSPRAAVAPVPIIPEEAAPVLARLLRMADGYGRGASPHQAIDIYLELIEGHPTTAEARCARQRLLEICDRYEQQGLLHQARGIYERLRE